MSNLKVKVELQLSSGGDRERACDHKKQKTNKDVLTEILIKWVCYPVRQTLILESNDRCWHFATWMICVMTG